MSLQGEDLSEEDLYLNFQLVSFCHKLGYVCGVVPFNHAFKTWMKRGIQTCRIIDFKSKDERKNIFGKLALEMCVIFFLLLVFPNVYALFANIMKSEHAMRRLKKEI